MDEPVHVGKEEKQVKQRYYVTSPQKLSHTSCVLSCSLGYCIFGLSADMGGIVISWDSGVRVSYRGGGWNYSPPPPPPRNLEIEYAYYISYLQVTEHIKVARSSLGGG